MQKEERKNSILAPVRTKTEPSLPIQQESSLHPNAHQNPPSQGYGAIGDSPLPPTPVSTLWAAEGSCGACSTA